MGYNPGVTVDTSGILFSRPSNFASGYGQYRAWPGANDDLGNDCCYDIGLDGGDGVDLQQCYVKTDDISLSCSISCDSNQLTVSFTSNHQNSENTNPVENKGCYDNTTACESETSNVCGYTTSTSCSLTVTVSQGKKVYAHSRDQSLTYIDTDGSVYCGSIPDLDSSSCWCSAGGIGNWNSTPVDWETGTPSCCGDDSNENWLSSQALYLDNNYGSGDGTNACCSLASDCVDDSTCTDSGQTKDADEDGDLDYCNTGTWVDCVDDTQCHFDEYCSNNDCVPHYLTVDSIQVLPSGIVNPIENSTRTMNVTVNVTNSTALDKCVIRIFNSTDSYSDPTITPFLGSIRLIDSQTQCFGEWGMEYWRNPGDWNVSVDLNLTIGTSNFTSETFTYNELISAIPNVTFINFTGLPGQTVNSTSAYPLSIKNGGNVKVNVSMNGTDFVGETDPSYVIDVSNVGYNESESGNFVSLTHDYSLVFSFLNPAEERYLYFRAYVPLGFKAQFYNNTIDIKRVKALS
jgi:hypothetical protein